LIGQVGFDRGLRVLLLGGNGIGVRGAEALGAALGVHPFLRELSLAASALGDAGAHPLARGIGRVESLDLASNGIGVSGLGGLLEAGKSLQLLDLGSTPSSRVLGAPENDLGDAIGGGVIGDWLAGNPSLGRMDLRHAGVRSRGAVRIAAGLEHNENLFELQLGKFVSRRIKHRIRARLDSNRARVSPERLQTSWHVAAILSVYRSKTPGR
jgi:hypothetical protein